MHQSWAVLKRLLCVALSREFAFTTEDEKINPGFKKKSEKANLSNIFLLCTAIFKNKGQLHCSF